MTNTKEYHFEILAVAHEAIKDVDVTQEYPRLAIAKLIVVKTNCHITTAKNNLDKAARQKRYPDWKTPQWGGKRK